MNKINQRNDLFELALYTQCYVSVVKPARSKVTNLGPPSYGLVKYEM